MIKIEKKKIIVAIKKATAEMKELKDTDKLQICKDATRTVVETTFKENGNDIPVIPSDFGDRNKVADFMYAFDIGMRYATLTPEDMLMYSDDKNETVH